LINLIHSNFITEPLSRTRRKRFLDLKLMIELMPASGCTSNC
jgi:hypothetical protein